MGESVVAVRIPMAMEPIQNILSLSESFVALSKKMPKAVAKKPKTLPTSIPVIGFCLGICRTSRDPHAVVPQVAAEIPPATPPKKAIIVRVSVIFAISYCDFGLF